MSSQSQVQPRHIASNASTSDLDDLPEVLQGRLHLRTVHEHPTGTTPEGYSPPESYESLSVLCGPEKDICVTLNYVYYVSKYTFKRKSKSGVIENWYLCHTWTRTWGEGSDSGTVFVNLDTGEHCKTCSLSYWRGSLEISPDGKIAIIEAGIMASSARKLYILDLESLPNISVLHYEENWDSESSAHFIVEEEDSEDSDDSEDSNNVSNCLIEFNYGFSKKQFARTYMEDNTAPEETHGWPQPKKEVIVVRKKDHMLKPVESNYLENYNQQKEKNIIWTKYLVGFGIHDLIDVSETVRDVVRDADDYYDGTSTSTSDD